jgi:hypothetical protein
MDGSVIVNVGAADTLVEAIATNRMAANVAVAGAAIDVRFRVFVMWQSPVSCNSRLGRSEALDRG